MNSVDAEQSFIIYKNVVSDRHHSLLNRSTIMLVELYYSTCNEPDPVCSNSEESETECTYDVQ